MDKLEELIARSDIHNMVLRYCRGMDRRDWDAVRATYHPDAHDQHGDYEGSVDGLIEWLGKRHAEFPYGFHTVANCLIEFADDTTAAVETYFIALLRMPSPHKPGEFIDQQSTGRYVDRFEKRNGEWRVANRRCVYDSRFQQPSAASMPRLPGSVGRRDKQDWIFKLRNDLGIAP